MGGVATAQQHGRLNHLLRSSDGNPRLLPTHESSTSFLSTRTTSHNDPQEEGVYPAKEIAGFLPTGGPRSQPKWRRLSARLSSILWRQH